MLKEERLHSNWILWYYELIYLNWGFFVLKKFWTESSQNTQPRNTTHLEWLQHISWDGLVSQATSTQIFFYSRLQSSAITMLVVWKRYRESQIAIAPTLFSQKHRPRLRRSLALKSPEIEPLQGIGSRDASKRCREKIWIKTGCPQDFITKNPD